MPLYSFHCDRCDKIEDAYRHVSERHNGPECCHQKMKMVIVAPAVMADLPGYESPVTGKWIEGKSARREDLRRSGCRPYEDGEREHAKRVRADEERKQDVARHEAVARAYYSLSPEKQRKLRLGY